jgi:hypothetical protein
VGPKWGDCIPSHQCITKLQWPKTFQFMNNNAEVARLRTQGISWVMQYRKLLLQRNSVMSRWILHKYCKITRAQNCCWGSCVSWMMCHRRKYNKNATHNKNSAQKIMQWPLETKIVATNSLQSIEKCHQHFLFSGFKPELTRNVCFFTFFYFIII